MSRPVQAEDFSHLRRSFDSPLHQCWLGHFDGADWSVDCDPDHPTTQITRAIDGTLLHLRDNAIRQQVFE